MAKEEDIREEAHDLKEDHEIKKEHEAKKGHEAEDARDIAEEKASVADDSISDGEKTEASEDEASSFAKDSWEIKRIRFLDPELQKLQDELFADEAGDAAAEKKPHGSGAVSSSKKEHFAENKALEKKGRSRRKKSLLEQLTYSKEPDSSAIDGYISYARGHVAVMLAALGLFALLSLLVFAAVRLRPQRDIGSASASAATQGNATASRALSEAELRELERQNAIENELGTYEDLGIVEVSGYINVRSEPNVLDMTNIIGQLTDGAVCSILSSEGDWYQISSGGITGYVSAQYIFTGEEARSLARDSFAERAIIETEVLNIRSAPTVDGENVIGKARMSERYEVLSIEDDWAEIIADFMDGYDTAYIYIGDGNAVIRYCLNEARRLDLREMALTQYDNLVVCATDGYVNIRETPEDDGINNIIGQFPENAGAELLETVESNGTTWYRITSGGVTGYVSAQYCITGNAARNIAVDAAQLTAYITTDALNVRSEPSLEANAWTQVTRNQSYHVLDQLDGWVEIELDSTDGEGDSDRAFISTRDNNVEVTYGLPTAIEYYPAIEAENAQMAFRNKIVNYAVQFVGNPYVWGGTSLTNGADCSGFTQSVLKHFGISIPRVSRDQARAGVRVTSDVMRPGDLIFYANSSGTINHVAMYIGNGQVVNAASSRSGIRIYRWNYRTPVAIRDVIGDRTG